jgi:AMP deaminase
VVRAGNLNIVLDFINSLRLREIFLKQDNYIKGRFLAELTQELFQNLKESKYQYAEYRISVYGR